MAHPPSPARRVDLHGLPPHQALRRLEQELHACRVRGEPELLAITGRGWGNLEQEPILRRKAEAWLRGPQGKALGVSHVTLEHKGGALRIRLKTPG